jgi:hypothetical protein
LTGASLYSVDTASTRGCLTLVLVSVKHALPELEAFLAAHGDDGRPLSTDELRALARLTVRVIETSSALAALARMPAPKPRPN